METSDAKLAEEVHKLNECFEQLKSGLAITKILIASSTIVSFTWRGKTWQMSNILGVNVWRLWVYPLQSQIMSLKNLLRNFQQDWS